MNPIRYGRSWFFGGRSILSWGALHQRDREKREADVQVSKDPRGLQTIFFRRDAADQQPSLTIRIAQSECERRRANLLLNRMYAWRGYGTNRRLETSPNSV